MSSQEVTQSLPPTGSPPTAPPPPEPLIIMTEEDPKEDLEAPSSSYHPTSDSQSQNPDSIGHSRASPFGVPSFLRALGVNKRRQVASRGAGRVGGAVKDFPWQTVIGPTKEEILCSGRFHLFARGWTI